MNPFKTIGRWIGEGMKAKFVDYPDIVGGFEIFRDFVGLGGPWSQSKGLATYKKSLYVFACVKKIAQKTASIDFTMFEIKNSSGDKEEVFVNDGLDLLYRPNPFQTKTEFYEKYMINKLLSGETFVLKVRDEQGIVRELWNLRPDYMRVVIDKNDPRLIKGYEFIRQDGKTLFDPEDIIHDAYPSPLEDFGGMSALAPAKIRVDTEQFASEYQSNFFKNNARPDFILQTDGKVSGDQKEEIRESWDKRHKGKKNTGKGAILEGGLKYQQVSISQREMDYIESMKFTRDDILVAFGVPKPIVAITEDVNYANANTAMEIFLKETIQPEIARLCEKLNEHLIYPEVGDNFFIHYDEGFLPRNEKEQAEIDEIEIRTGVKLINEAREERGREAIEGGWSFYKPFSESPVGGLTPKKSKSRGVATRNAKEIFRGRGKAYSFLKKREGIEARLYDELGKELKKTGVLKGVKFTKEDDHAQDTGTEEEKEPVVHKYVAEDQREKYADIVNKQIDKKGEHFQPALKEFMKEQQASFIKLLNSFYKPDKSKAFDDLWQEKVQDWAGNERIVMAEFSLPFMEEFAAEAGKTALDSIAPETAFDLTEELRMILQERAKKLGLDVTNTTMEKLIRQLAEGLKDGEGIAQLTARVESVYTEFDTYRAEMIARTEATAANNLGFQEGYKQSGVANAKEWIATGDGRTRDSHAAIDGYVVGVDEIFPNGLKYPGDPAGPGEEVVNCRCVLAPAFRE